MSDRFKAALHSIDTDGTSAWVRLEPLVKKDNLVFPEAPPRFTITLNRQGFDQNGKPAIHKEKIYTLGYVKKGTGIVVNPDGEGYLVKIELSGQVYATDEVDQATHDI